MLAQRVAAEDVSQLRAFGQPRRQFRQQALIAIGHVQLGGPHQIVENQQAVEHDSIRVGVLRIHQMECFGDITKGFDLLRRRTELRHGAVER